MSDSLRSRIDADLDRLIGLRRSIHENPELMYEEHETAKRVVGELDEVGVKNKPGLAGGTGVLGYLPASQGEESAPTVALRADMDALPILEETGVSYASKTEGKMHACGHDGHTTILVGAMRALAQAERPNNVLFVFQPAEEGGAGGRRMCEDGALDGSVLGRPADVIYGLHGWPARQQGAFSSKVGALMASTDQFFVTIKGRGGHAAVPESTADPVIAVAQLINALQTIISRNTSPNEAAVLTVATLEAGTATNIIPETAKFSGTVRTVDPDVRTRTKKRFHEVVHSLCDALGVKADIRWEEGYPVTMNDDWATSRFFEIANNAMGAGRVSVEPHPKMGAEDFSFYGHYVPACFYFVGLQRPGEENPAGLHTPQFDFNEAVIPDCVEMMCRLALAPVSRP